MNAIDIKNDAAGLAWLITRKLQRSPPRNRSPEEVQETLDILDWLLGVACDDQPLALTYQEIDQLHASILQTDDIRPRWTYWCKTLADHVNTETQPAT